MSLSLYSLKQLQLNGNNLTQQQQQQRVTLTLTNLSLSLSLTHTHTTKNNNCANRLVLCRQGSAGTPPLLSHRGVIQIKFTQDGWSRRRKIRIYKTS